MNIQDETAALAATAESLSVRLKIGGRIAYEHGAEDFSGGDGGGAVNVSHNSLTGRSAANAHPIISVSGLRAELSDLDNRAADNLSKINQLKLKSDENTERLNGLPDFDELSAQISANAGTISAVAAAGDFLNSRLTALSEELTETGNAVNDRADELSERITAVQGETNARADELSERITAAQGEMNARADELSERITAAREELAEEILNVTDDFIYLLSEETDRTDEALVGLEQRFNDKTDLLEQGVASLGGKTDLLEQGVASLGGKTDLLEQGVTSLGGITDQHTGYIANAAAEISELKNTASETADGLMSAADKTKLDGVAAGANNYTLPAASANTIGGVTFSAATPTAILGYSSVGTSAAAARADHTHPVSSQFELGMEATGDNTCYIDFHSTNGSGAKDYDARIICYAGTQSLFLGAAGGVYANEKRLDISATPAADGLMSAADKARLDQLWARFNP